MTVFGVSRSHHELLRIPPLQWAVVTSANHLRQNEACCKCICPAQDSSAQSYSPLDTHPCSAFRCLQKLVEGLKAEIEAAHLPIVHFTVDLWTCKLSGSKYLGIHIFWVDKAFAFRHALLSVSWSQSSVFASFSRVLFFQVLST